MEHRAHEGIQLFAGGDVMLGEHPAMVGRGTATRLLRQPDYDPFATVRPLMAGADVAMANLECVISDWSRFTRPSRRECRGPSAATARLLASGFDVFSVANNHFQQYGEAAVWGTVQILRDAGLGVVGLAGERPGTCLPLDLERRGRHIRILGYSLRPRQGFSEVPAYAEGTRDGILADIAEAKELGALVVASIHWGDEFIHVPAPEQRALGRAMADAGCDLIVGHHPHVLQGWEVHGGSVILYSLGNLVFDMPWLPELRRTALCQCQLGAADGPEVQWHPLVLDDDHCPVTATGDDRQWIEEFLRTSRQDLESPGGGVAGQSDHEYRQALDKAMSRERWTRNRFFLRNIHRYRPDVSGELVGKFLMRRVGLLHD